MQQTTLVDAARLVRETEDLVRIVVEAEALSAERSARICGCSGCWADARDAAFWAIGMLRPAPTTVSPN